MIAIICFLMMLIFSASSMYFYFAGEKDTALFNLILAIYFDLRLQIELLNRKMDVEK